MPTVTVLQTILPAYKLGGSDYGPRIARKRLVSASRAIQEVVLWSGRFYGGAVSWEFAGATGAADFEAFKDIWNVCSQQGKACLFFDDKENTGTDENIGTGTGAATTFQLRLASTVTGQTVYRTIKHPLHGSLSCTRGGVLISNSVTIKKDGVAFAESGNWSVDNTTGIVTFNVAPLTGVVLTASFRFVNAVVFEDEALPVSQSSINFFVESARLLEVNA